MSDNIIYIDDTTTSSTSSASDGGKSWDDYEGDPCETYIAHTSDYSECINTQTGEYEINGEYHSGH